MASRVDHPESQLQIGVVRYLDLALPPEVRFTASLTGVHLNIRQRVRAKAMGVRPGWTDLQFLLEDGRPGFIELKADQSLSAVQRGFRDYCYLTGVRWAKCRSIEAVAEVLESWGVRLRVRPDAFKTGVLRRAA
jgi:hypothetical protein